MPFDDTLTLLDDTLIRAALRFDALKTFFPCKRNPREKCTRLPARYFCISFKPSGVSFVVLLALKNNFATQLSCRSV